MSILIKGIEIPEVFCGADIVLYEGVNGAAFPRKYKISADKIVPVPPHGRLIDADALVSVIAILQDKTDNAVVWEQMRYIADDMQTVIPAESEEE